MKRFLSLVLTLVMVMSLVTVSAGAKDFTDNDTITYDEAVAVVSEIGVVDGYTDGKFNPTNTLTRQAAAKIICNLKLGPTTAAELHADTAPYKDVPANNEFAGYIAYCQKEGIISGYADGSFRPGNPLTGYAFMKMLLGALGYDATLEQYVGGNWSINVAKQAIHIGLNKGLEGEFNGIKPVTREEACLYAFNTLQADLVEYGQRLTTNINGTEVTLSSGGAKSREWSSQQTRINNIRDDAIIQFAEEYFSKLVKAPDDDKFMRPAHTWVYDKKIQIGTWVDQDKLLETYTSGVSGRDLYDLLGSATIRDFDLEVYVDGHEAGKSTTGYENNYYEYEAKDEEFVSADLKRSNTKSLGATGDGVLTEVFIDKDAEIVRVVSIHTWLSQATSAYSESKETATLKVFTILGASVGSVSKTINVEDVAKAADVTADDFYLVCMSDKDTSVLEVAVIDDPEILEDSTVTKFSNGLDRSKVTAYPESLTTGGENYDVSDRAVYDADTLNEYDADLLANNSYNVYLDKYGYFIGIDLFEGEKQYVFITGYDMRNSNLSIKTAEAAGIFLDGTMKTMTVNVKDTNKNIRNMVYTEADPNTAKDANAGAYYKQWGTHVSDGVYLLNRWYTYTVTEAGVYTLKPCVDKKTGEAMMLASKSENDAEKELKLNCSKLRLDSVTGDAQTPPHNTCTANGLLIGETMQYEDDSTVLDSYRAYGEDASVFITVDVDDVSATFTPGAGVAGKITRAITDVNGVYTGVQDVDIITTLNNRVTADYCTDDGTLAEAGDNDAYWFLNADDGKSYVGENAYAVFDKNNFIIGAVILGEAQGNAATKAYILDPVKYERYENGTYYWQFEAVINGEIVKQEAESKFQDTIDLMRKNQYEIVELRYKGADSEIVTDVKEVKRIDTGVDVAHSGKDGVYGYPFAEIKSFDAVANPAGHQVNDKEDIYDVVLTGDDNGTWTDMVTSYDENGATANVEFKYVTRERTNAEHIGDEEFVATEVGVLRLQGRTLYVLDGQHDYGVDFTRDAKAVVIQPENGKLKTRDYTTVQEAIDSLGDPDPKTDAKEFRGIITAPLNAQGVAEWVVFFSDTNVETKNDTAVGKATMDVIVNIRLPGNDAVQYYTVEKVERPESGNIAMVPSPDKKAGKLVIPGYRALQDELPVIWNKDGGASVTFDYVATNPDQLDVEAAKLLVDALDGKVFKQNADGDKDWNNAADGKKFKDEIEDAITTALTGTGVTPVNFDWTAGGAVTAPSATDAPVNAVKGGNPTGTMSPKVIVTLNKGGENILSKTLTFSLQGLPYAQTTDGLADARIAAAKKTIEDAIADGSLKTADKLEAGVANAAAAYALVQTAVETLVDSTTNDLTITVAVPGDGEALTKPGAAAGGADGSVKVKITVADANGDGNAENIDNVTIVIPCTPA